jgi:Protein of unknown function (DUF3761)
MTVKIALFAAAVTCLFAGAAFAQVPAGAPAGTTGICKDGTYSQAPSKSGACSGHKGVKTWYATAAAAPAAAPAMTAAKPAPATAAPAMMAAPKAAPAPAAMTAAKPAPASAAPAMAAAGGGAGQVWVNTASKVYHCQGDKYYGKTKAGSYMTEAAAVSAGNHPDHGKACH